MNDKHQADDSYMGYVFQGQFALVLLLGAKDNESISVETEDDVVLEGNEKSLHQLKHSFKTNHPRLTEKNTGFWKTIEIWANDSDITSKQFVFVTCSEIAAGSPLELLQVNNVDRSSVITALDEEAYRVISEVDDAKKSGETNLPHKERLSGCVSYQKLSDCLKEELVKRILIKPDSFNISQVQAQVEFGLTTVPKEMRSKIARRLIEWWDLRIVEALTRKLPRLISKGELQRKIVELISDHYGSSLPDDFSKRKPEQSDIANNGIMEEQINLVGGGPSRILRAKVSRWQARNQRQKWLEDDVSLAQLLEEFDDQLINEWEFLFEPMCDDFRDESEETLKIEGCKLLDWSHSSAPNDISPIGFIYNQPFLIRGTYQQLADEIKIGWHPEFKARLSNSKK